MKKKFLLYLFVFNLFFSALFAKNDLYEKIDIFGEVLENIKKDYVDDVNQSEIMDSAINGVLQSLDPYSAYMSPELFKEMQTDTKGEFGGLGIEIGMEAGVVKVISQSMILLLLRLVLEQRLHSKNWKRTSPREIISRSC